MRLINASTILSLMVALGCSACTASDKVDKAMSAGGGMEKQALVVGIETNEETNLSSDVLFHVFNSSNDSLEILIWNTPLESELSADLFTVTLDDVPVDYQGRLIKRSVPGEKDYRTIPAHERIEAVIDLAVFYDLSAPGEYQVRLTPPGIDGQVRLNEQTPVQLDDTTLTIRVDMP